MTEEKKETSVAKTVKRSKALKANDPNAIFTKEGINTTMMVCKQFMASGAVPSSFKTPEAVMMVIQAGRELGMKPIESINGMMIINGQIRLWGTALSARVTRLGYKINWKESTPELARVTVIDPEGVESGEESYSKTEASQASLLGKGAWIGHTKTMLRWRALATCIKFNYPHLLQGIGVAEDSDELDSIEGEVLEEQEDNASKLLKAKVEDDIAEEVLDKTVKAVQTKNAVGENKAEVKEPISKMTDLPGNVVEREIEEPVKKEKPAEAPVADKIADKILDEEEKKDGVVEGEIVEEKKEDLTVGNIEGEVAKIRTMMKKAGSKEATVLQYFKVEKLDDIKLKEATELCAFLNEKIDKISKGEGVKAPAKTPPATTTASAKPKVEGESVAAKSMREAKEKVEADKEKGADPVEEKPKATNGLPSDVCKYLNSIEALDPGTLPPDILLLKIDSSQGKFRGYDAYPSLKAEIEKMNK